MRNLPRLAFVLFIGTAVTIFCTLLLSSGFLTADKKSSASRKGQVFIGEEREENKIFAPTLGPLNVSQQFLKMASLDAHLLRRGFTNEEIGSMSPLGKWLLAPEGTPPPQSNTNKFYLILIWKYGQFLERRHIRRFTSTKLVKFTFCNASFF
ncbi:hypothetical protein PUN28_011937 [Cardiocondyla obscurior]|uniref:Uncharacterized protein n=1 Tax=Cardiocondyla obscurior TaxID=286306 RepID=A0AAW2FBE9_9HYME